MFITSSHIANTILSYRKWQQQMITFFKPFTASFIVSMFLLFCFQSMNIFSFDVHITLSGKYFITDEKMTQKIRCFADTPLVNHGAKS